MFDRPTRFASYGSGMALAVAVVTTTSAHQHSTQTVVGDTGTRHGASVTAGEQGASAQLGSAVTKVSVTPGCYHHYP